MGGYGFCWVCRELVARDGNNYRISAERQWKETLCEDTFLSMELVEEMLKYQAEIDLIDRKALEEGDLYIPKMKDYGDEWSKRLQREERVTPKKLLIRYETEHNDTIRDIYTHWNTLGIKAHRDPEKHVLEIASVLRKGHYKPEEIKQAMSNYAYILLRPEYRWTYRWECWEFVRRGMEKFIDLDSAKKSFLKDGYSDDEDEIKDVQEGLKEL